MKKWDALSDESLQLLIAEAEQDIIAAPPDLCEAVRKRIQTDKRRQLRRYSLQVMTSAAAVIALVILLGGRNPEIPSKEAVLAASVPSREAVLAQMEYRTPSERLWELAEELSLYNIWEAE